MAEIGNLTVEVDAAQAREMLFGVAEEGIELVAQALNAEAYNAGAPAHHWPFLTDDERGDYRTRAAHLLSRLRGGPVDL